MKIYISILSVFFFVFKIFGQNVYNDLSYISCSEGGHAGFIVPAGVTKVIVDLWGAGGSGGLTGGGQGGGYIHAAIKVKMNDNIGWSIGEVSGTTIVYVNNVQKLVANAGADNGANNKGDYSIAADANLSGWGLKGQLGKPNILINSGGLTVDYFTLTTQIIGTHKYNFKSITCGNGGNGANSIHTSGDGGYYLLQYDSPATGGGLTYTALVETKNAVNGTSPGGGGGGSISYPTGSGQTINLPSGIGGNGKIIIGY